MITTLSLIMIRPGRRHYRELMDIVGGLKPLKANRPYEEDLQHMNIGRVARVIGPVVDVEFEEGKLPPLKTPFSLPTRPSTTLKTT